MAIDANEGAILVDRQQLFTEILSQTVFVVTFGARRDGNVRLQASERCWFRDVNMARRTLCDVLFLLSAAFVNKLRRDSRWLGCDKGAWRKLMTPVAVSSYWLLRLPMTVETRCVIVWRCLERCGSRCVADGAVVVTLRPVRETQLRDDVLMLVMGKLDIELQLRRGIPKRVSNIVAR